MKGVSILRRLMFSRPCSSSLMETTMLSTAAATASYSTFILSDELRKPLFNSGITPRISTNLPSGLLINRRNFSSDHPDSGESKMVLIETEKQLNDSLLKAQDESVPSIFYFTAVWCGPCKFISPFIGRLSEKYPHVTTYKIDIDKEDLAGALSKLNITAVPTVYFFKDGKKASAVVGADANQLSATMEQLYK